MTILTREVLLPMVDDVVCPEPTYHQQLLRAVDSGHTGALRLRHLYCDAAYAAACSVD